MGRGPAGRSQQQRMGGGGRERVGVDWLEGWGAPGAPPSGCLLHLSVQVDPGIGNMQAACPASLLRIGWKEL